MNFPKIKRAKIDSYQTSYINCFEDYIEFYQEEDIKDERKSRAKWAKEMYYRIYHLGVGIFGVYQARKNKKLNEILTELEKQAKKDEEVLNDP